jgi:hypothetical protein
VRVFYLAAQLFFGYDIRLFWVFLYEVFILFLKRALVLASIFYLKKTASQWMLAIKISIIHATKGSRLHLNCQHSKQQLLDQKPAAIGIDSSYKLHTQAMG